LNPDVVMPHPCVTKRKLKIAHGKKRMFSYIKLWTIMRYRALACDNVERKSQGKRSKKTEPTSTDSTVSCHYSKIPIDARRPILSDEHIP